MNIVGHLRRALALLTSRREKQIEAHRQPERKRFNPPVLRGYVRMYRREDGKPIFGPVSIPTEDFHYVSKQACKHRLRALAFQAISQQQPLLSRSLRRRWARAAAGIHYLEMMQDNTNVVENEKELVRAA